MTGRARVLVVDDEAGLREMLGVLLRRAGYEVTLAEGVTIACELVRAGPSFDAIITDLMMPDGTGMDVLDAARAADETTQTLMITAYATMEKAVEAMRRGAYDYVQKPFKNTELLATLEKALEKREMSRDVRELRAQAKAQFESGGIVGKSPRMQKVMDMVRRVASARPSVLITGESGTGKELVARALHTLGDRAPKPFVVVNCGALPETLMESELFGHEKGAFTGATARKEGLFRAAGEGTIFLDEVGELSQALQVKLLRVLQERKVRSVGGEREIEVEARVVAATNRDVEKEVADGRFRQDLFYRLNVLRIELPALRERPEDLPLLAEHFLAKHNALQGRRLVFSPEALRWITAQPYPGNVRELENVVERAVTLAVGARVERSDLPDGGRVGEDVLLGDVALPESGLDLDAYLGEIERRVLVRALDASGGVRTAAAKKLGLTFRSFRYRLAKHGLGEDTGGDEPPE